MDTCNFEFVNSRFWKGIAISGYATGAAVFATSWNDTFRKAAERIANTIFSEQGYGGDVPRDVVVKEVAGSILRANIRQLTPPPTFMSIPKSDFASAVLAGAGRHRVLPDTVQETGSLRSGVVYRQPAARRRPLYRLTETGVGLQAPRPPRETGVQRWMKGKSLKWEPAMEGEFRIVRLRVDGFLQGGYISEAGKPALFEVFSQGRQGQQSIRSVASEAKAKEALLEYLTTM